MSTMQIGLAMFVMAVVSFYWQRYSEMGLDFKDGD